MLNKEDKGSNVLLTYGKALIRGIALTVLLLIIAALIYNFTGLGEEVFDTAIWIVLILGICFGSIYGSLKIGRRGYLHGAVIGALYTIIILLIAFLIEQGDVTMKGFLIRFIMSIVIGALSGMIGMVMGSRD